MEFFVENLSGLPSAAKQIAPLLRSVVALYGPMGAGKTTLVSALMREMGSADEVTSPTFALVNDYLTGAGEHIYHFDFYRINSLSEAFDLGYEDYFFSGNICLVEWPEKIEELLPDDTLRLYIDVMPDGGRRIVCN